MLGEYVMIKDKTLYDLQNLVRKLVSDKNSIDDVRSFLLQLIFCFTVRKVEFSWESPLLSLF